MTARNLVFLALGLVGCAAIPLGGDDISLCPDGGCAVPYDGGPFGVDGPFNPPDAGLGDGALPASRLTLCPTEHCMSEDGTLAANECVSLDAGIDAATDASVPACRVIDATHAMCVPSGAGEFPMSCTSGSDCAPGYECLADGICRHYCCDGDKSCGGLAGNASGFYCDVQMEAAKAVAVPVCAAIVGCDPLTMYNPCGPGFTCRFVQVRVDYRATCDETGPGKLGDSCEIEHCGSEYACIGPEGTRTCQQMCSSSVPCPPGLSCTMSAETQSYGVGICSN